ncbi:hypothetical protein EJ02DRAFT_351799 [Clathrospora elynae]|uniref:Uncharacterized protein n=1 Tax=Clathrospora elynae TaxID=706981 RepID=A0A6A5SJ78_9PLEO|nr:hypothetical protein EJ02DRAFT_351799 [Clathrospora elynae]
MMKRKFSLNLAPVKTACKADITDKPTPEPTQSHSASPSQHRRHTSKDSICDNSAYINRRPLDEHTERELRLACRLILQNFKPSDHGMENTDPKLDFGVMGRRKESKAQPAEVRVRMPTGAPAELASSSFMARKLSTKTRTRAKADLEIKARTQADMPTRANSSRKRADFGWLDERDDARNEKLKSYGKSPSIDLSRSAAFRNDSDEDVTLPVAIASSFAYSHVPSSAPTTASLPPGKVVNRRSHQSDNSAAIADEQAAAWMRLELDKQQQQEASDPQARPTNAVRPPSRAASITNSVKEYVFPGSRSRALSRVHSKENLRITDDNDSQDLSRSGSGAGWRSWGIPRKLSSRSNSRPGTSRAHVDEPAQHRKSESSCVNLNRELPPLPSLDSWKDLDMPPEFTASSPKSPTAGTHIASLMRSHEQDQDCSPAARKQQAHAIPQPTRLAPSSPCNMPTMVTGWSSTSNLDRGSSSHTRQRSGGTNSIPTSHSKMSVDAPNFSRKMSLDTAPSRRTLSNDVKTTRKEEQKSRLKNIFSGWMTKKDKKEDWMLKMEKEGVKEGVLVHEGTTALPIVRY